MKLIMSILDGELLIGIIFAVDSFPHHVPSKDINHLFPLQIVALVLFDLVELLVTKIIKDIHIAFIVVHAFSFAI
jgi:ABC-type microcin C transport system permease subunit YejB